jgi:hypothetical protein
MDLLNFWLITPCLDPGNRSRKISKTVATARAAQAIRELAQKGHHGEAIFCVARPYSPDLRAAIDLFEAGGWTIVRPTLRGRITGSGRVLSAAQDDAFLRMIIGKCPEQLKMDFSF